jgi:hypothetical protein
MNQKKTIHKKSILNQNFVKLFSPRWLPNGKEYLYTFNSYFKPSFYAKYVVLIYFVFSLSNLQ